MSRLIVSMLSRGSMFREIVLPAVMLCLFAISGFMVMHSGGRISEPLADGQAETWCSHEGTAYWSVRGQGFMTLTPRVDTLGRHFVCDTSGVRLPVAEEPTPSSRKNRK